MCVQTGARDVLARLRQRRQPANDLFDSVLTINTPSDIRAELDQLHASYEVVNQQARGNPDWDAHYAEFQRFYADLRPRTEGATAWLRVGSGTLNSVRNRAHRLEEWKAALLHRGVAVPEPEKKPPPDSGSLQDTLRIGLLALAGLTVLSVVRR